MLYEVYVRACAKVTCNRASKESETIANALLALLRGVKFVYGWTKDEWFNELLISGICRILGTTRP